MEIIKIEPKLEDYPLLKDYGEFNVYGNPFTIKIEERDTELLLLKTTNVLKSTKSTSSQDGTKKKQNCSVAMECDHHDVKQANGTNNSYNLSSNQEKNGFIIKNGIASISKRLVCSACCKTFANRTTLRRHKCSRQSGVQNSENNKKYQNISTIKAKNSINNGCRSAGSKSVQKNFKRAPINSLQPSKVKISVIDEIFPCECCDESYTTIDALQSHTLLLHGKAYACRKCPKSFSNYYYYQIHTTIHNDLKRPLCNVCSRAFTTVDRLQRHMLIHLREKPHVCTICSKGYLQSSDLTYHMKTAHVPIKKSFACKMCTATFIGPAMLLSHLRIHCNKKSHLPHMCPVCLTPFYYTANFKRHMLIHSGFKPFNCDICKTNHSTRRLLKRHMRYHIKKAILMA